MRRIRRIVSFVAVSIALTLPSQPARAAETSPKGWTERFVVTYATSLHGTLPSGARLLRTDGKRAVVDLGRRALRSDLARFRDPSIVSVEPDLRATIATTPTDPSYVQQWDLSDPLRPGGDYSVHAPGAWGVTTGSASIVVAVLDTGITKHAEFTGRTVPGYDMIGDIRTANDGNGRDPDPSDPGDWITQSENSSYWFYGCGVSNSSWHGTHVAGTIAATANNGIGVAGLNWAAKIEPVRVLGKCGGYASDIADGITWASGGSVSGTSANTNPAKIISLSLGGASACPTYLQSAIDGAIARGSLVVVAAGNENLDAAAFYPANCDGTIVVAATARDGKRAYYSNYGSTVTIAAPGGDRYKDAMILSTVNIGKTSPSRDGYAAYQGTSMATPHVSGVLSLLLSKSPSMSQSDVIAAMRDTATPFPADSGANSCSTGSTCGAGIINATALLGATDPPPPAAPLIVADPSVSGTPTVGAPLAAAVGSWSGNPVPTLAYQWLICSQNGAAATATKPPTGCSEIKGATASSYTPAPGYVGSRLRFAVRASNSQGTSTRYSAASELVDGPPYFTSPPSISGRSQVGRTLSVRIGSVAGLPTLTFTHRWFTCSSKANSSATLQPSCDPVAIGTGATYLIVSRPARPYIVVEVTATSSDGRSTTAYSSSIGPIR